MQSIVIGIRNRTRIQQRPIEYSRWNVIGTWQNHPFPMLAGAFTLPKKYPTALLSLCPWIQSYKPMISCTTERYTAVKVTVTVTAIASAMAMAMAMAIAMATLTTIPILVHSSTIQHSQPGYCRNITGTQKLPTQNSMLDPFKASSPALECLPIHTLDLSKRQI